MKLSLAQAMENLNNSGNSGDFHKLQYFSLSDDQDSAHIRFLFERPETSQVFRTHTVQLKKKDGGTTRHEVDCLGKDCPLCREALKYKGQYPVPVTIATDKMFMPVLVYDRRDGGTVTTPNSVFIWTRPTRFNKDELMQFSVHSAQPLNSNIVEVIRVGVKRDKKTTYKLYSCVQDYNGNPIAEKDTSLASLYKTYNFTDDIIYGAKDSAVLAWSVNDMEEYLLSGTFPSVIENTTSPAEEKVNKEPEKVEHRDRLTDLPF